MSILNNNKPVAQLGRTSHDLSSTHAFSMRPAVLRPVVVQDCVPDSAFRINCSDLVRTSALQTAAFLRGKHELDFFFVPYNLLYSRFNDIVLERGDAHSPAIESMTAGDLPVVPLECLYFNAAFVYVVFRCSQLLHTKDWAQGELYWNGLFSQMYETIAGRTYDVVYYEFILRCLCYNEINPDDNFTYDGMSFVGYDALAMLDTLGYGNFGAVVVGFMDDMINDESHNTQQEFLAFMGLIMPNLLGLVRSYFSNDSFDGSFATGVHTVSPLRLFAYQKIFYDRFRDEVFDNNPSYSFAFSADYSIASLRWNPLDFAGNDNSPLLTFLRPRTRLLKKDLLSGLYPSAQYSAPGDAFDNRSMDALKLDNYSDSVAAPNIRFALAMQKYRETLLRAGSRSKDVLRAMFGVESRYINDTYVHYIGSFSGMLELNKVSATAEGGSYSVGDLAGNVFSSIQGDTIEFTCNDFGCIIGVMSFFPEVLHNNYGLSPHVLKTLPLHFFKSQFEDLGLQPVSSSVVSLGVQDGFRYRFAERVLGYSARYNEYKINLDFAHDQFGNGHAGDILGLPDTMVRPQTGFNSNYVVTRPVASDVSESSVRNYLLPDCMDSLFSTLDTGDITNYHFDVILDVNINAVLPMSNLGLPY